MFPDTAGGRLFLAHSVHLSPKLNLSGKVETRGFQKFYMRGAENLPSYYTTLSRCANKTFTVTYAELSCLIYLQHIIYAYTCMINQKNIIVYLSK